MKRFLRPPAIVLALITAAVEAASGAAPRAVPEFPEALALRILTTQCSFGPRVPGTPAHERCLTYLEETLRASAGNVSLQRFRAKTDASPDTVTLTNLSARFGPPGAGVLFGAHWDSRPWADHDPDSANWGRPILGANDGASGVAVLLALATMLRQAPPPTPVQIVLFDGEDQAKEGNESGYLLGSRECARGLLPPMPTAVIVVDLVGGRELHVCREGYSDQFAGWLNDVLFGRARALGLSGFEDRVCYSILDDHLPFLDVGIPAVDLVDMHFPQWHTVQDVPGVCSQESLGQCGRLLADFLYGGVPR
jgi:glutaminyl-peptide cyclotransferase